MKLPQEMVTLNDDEAQRLLQALWRRDKRYYVAERFHLHHPWRPYELLSLTVDSFEFDRYLCLICDAKKDSEGRKLVPWDVRIMAGEVRPRHLRLSHGFNEQQLTKAVGLKHLWGVVFEWTPLVGYVSGRHKTRKGHYVGRRQYIEILHPNVRVLMRDYVAHVRQHARSRRFTRTTDPSTQRRLKTPIHGSLFHWTRQWYWQYLKDAREETGIQKHYTPHKARHTVNRRLRQMSVPLEVRAQMLHHVNKATTLRYDEVDTGELYDEATSKIYWSFGRRLSE